MRAAWGTLPLEIAERYPSSEEELSDDVVVERCRAARRTGESLSPRIANRHVAAAPAPALARERALDAQGTRGSTRWR